MRFPHLGILDIDSKNFWFHRKTRMRAELLPMRKQSLESVRYAPDRADDKVKFTDDALEMILNVPPCIPAFGAQGLCGMGQRE